MRWRVWALSALTLLSGLVVGGQVARADGEQIKAGAFGMLQSMSAEDAQKQARAWLQSIGKTDPATLQKFDAIWKDEQLSVTDRLAETFALGNAEAARILREAEVAEALPAFADDAKRYKAPAVLTDKKLPAFFRNNLALIYASRLARRGVYEEALAALRTTRPEDVVDPAAYLFHRAVAEHGLLEQKAATQSINRLLEDVVTSPERYKTIAVLMLMDMQTWKEKDLGSIARKMKNIERRLDLARGGPKTQKLQREVVRRLDEIIKKLENEAKKKGGGGG